MFEDIKIPSLYSGHVRKITVLFRYAKYLFAMNRPSEKEVINNFAEFIRPTVDEIADSLGYSVKWGTPSLTIRNSGEITLQDARIRQFFNIASEGILDITFQHKKDTDNKLHSTITVANSIQGYKCSYASSTFGRACSFNWAMTLDFCLKEPTQRKAISAYAKVATILTMATEEQYQAIRQSPGYKRAASIFKITPTRSRKATTPNGGCLGLGD